MLTMNELPSPDPRPAWLINHQAENTKLSMISVDGERYPFTIVTYGMFYPELPYSVGFEHPTELYISENVPPNDRPPILAHEIREKKRFNFMPEEERCVSALIVELQEVENTRTRKEYAAYVKKRAEYFDTASRYFENPQHAAGVSEQFRNGLILTSGLANNIARSLYR